MNVRDALVDRAEELGDAESRPIADGEEWLRGGVVFAQMLGATASFRLEPLIVQAALRTDGTAASSRGPDWVEFAPATIDQYALDRATAWFEAAWRRAER